MTDDTFTTARFNMVEQQVRPWEVIDDRVLSVMGTLPREAFVDDQYKGLAYADIEIPIGHGQHMLKPIVDGRILQALNIKKTDSILEIGTGSGYLTACLATLGHHVTSIEIHEDLASKAGDTLANLGFKNITLQVGDAMENIPDQAPFDVIAVTGSIDECQDILPKELNDGGRLFLITGQKPVMQAQLITRINGDIFTRETLFETEINSLDNVQKKEDFVF